MRPIFTLMTLQPICVGIELVSFSSSGAVMSCHELMGLTELTAELLQMTVVLRLKDF